MRALDFACLPFPLKRCPWSVISETPEVYTYLEWWEDFEVFKALPDGAASIGEMPALAYNALRECARIKADVSAKDHERSKREREEQARRARAEARRAERGR